MENTAEHSWHLIMMALIFQRFADETINIEKVLKMLAIHDLGEIETLDVFLYDAERKNAQEKEKASIEKLFEDLPADLKNEFKALWIEFAEGNSPEAHYARAMDRFQPFLSNLFNDGGSWKTMGISREQAIAKNRHIAEGSPKLWSVYQTLALEAERRGFFKSKDFQ